MFNRDSKTKGGIVRFTLNRAGVKRLFTRGLRIRSKKMDIFSHLKHAFKKYEISAKITKYFCNSNGNY